MKIRIALAAIFLCLLPAAAQADPLVITSGQLVGEGSQGTAINITGRGFTFSAATPHHTVLFGASTYPAGSSYLLGGNQGFVSGIGTLCYNGGCVSDGNLFDGEFVGGQFTFAAESFFFPQLDPSGPSTYSITVPFTLTGTVSGSGVNFPQTTLFVVGQGQLTYTYDIFFINGRTNYDFRRVEATFADPTPEPATLLLLATGLAGAAAARRRRGA